MAKFMIGFQIFLMFVFLKGLEVKGAPWDYCVEMMYKDDYYNTLPKEERFAIYCSNMSNFYACLNMEFKENTGFNLSQLANRLYLKTTEFGKVIGSLAAQETLVDEMCSNGTELNGGLLMDPTCLGQDVRRLRRRCERQAKKAYEIFSDINIEITTDEKVEGCLIMAYQMACLAAEVQERCGPLPYYRFKKVLERLGVFRSGLCSLEHIQSLKENFIENLPILEPQRSIYNEVFDLKKRRK